MIAAGAAGTVYDFTQAPRGTKAPPRMDLNGKVVTLGKAEIIIPPNDKPWQPSRSGSTKYKFCSFIIHYESKTEPEINGQREYFAGVRVFPRMIDNVEKYSHPTIMKDGKSQSSALMKLYAEFKEKDINDVSLHEFLAYLNSRPKVELKAVEVKNPEKEETIMKNMIGKFL